jgi:trimeric autotransporter adhesin
MFAASKVPVRTNSCPAQETHVDLARRNPSCILMESKHSSRKRFSCHVKFLALSLGLAAASLSPTHATTLYWDSNSTTAGAGTTPTGTWGTSNFWNTDSAGGAGTFTATTTSTDDVVFSAGSDATGTYTVTISGARAARSITIEDGTVQFGGASTPSLTIGSGGITLTGAANLNPSAATALTSILLSASQSWTNNSTGYFNLASSTAISGATGSGNITLRLDGTNATSPNTNGTNLGSTLRGVISNGGATSLSLEKNGTGTWLLSGANTYTGGFTLNNGIIDINVASVGSVGAITSSALGRGTLTINGGSLESRGADRTILNAVTVGGDFSIIGSNITTLSAAMNLGGAIRTITSTGGQHVLAGIMSNGGLIKAGSGTLELDGVNTFSLDTRIAAGSLQLSAGGTNLSLQNSTLDMNALDAGSLTFRGSTGTVAATLGGLKGTRDIALVNTSGTAVTLNVGNNNQSTTYSGALRDCLKSVC